MERYQGRAKKKRKEGGGRKQGRKEETKEGRRERRKEGRKEETKEGRKEGGQRRARSLARGAQVYLVALSVLRLALRRRRRVESVHRLRGM